MSPLFDLLDYFVYGAACLGGAAAVWWVYNSMVKGRREYLRAAARTQDPVLIARIKQGVFLQRVSFGAAAAATAVAISAFAWAYRAKHGYDVATPYLVLAGALAVAGVAGIFYAVASRHKL